MLDPRIIAAVAPTMAHSARRWIFHLGGIGFIPLGLLDSSIIPIPGTMDILTIVLAAGNADLWFYYALMATLGSVTGAYVTYRLARKGGEHTLGRKFSRRNMAKSYKIFSRWGFGAIAIAALLPPPAPLVPILIAAGAMHYSMLKFLSALTAGRIVRYSLLAYLGARYGRQMLFYISHHRRPIFLVGTALIVVVVAVFLILLLAKRNKSAPA